MNKKEYLFQFGKGVCNNHQNSYQHTEFPEHYWCPYRIEEQCLAEYEICSTMHIPSYNFKYTDSYFCPAQKDRIYF